MKRNVFNVFTLFVVVIMLAPAIISAQNLCNEPEGISYDAENDRYLVSNWSGQSIVAITPSGDQSYFATGLSHCANNLLVGDKLYVTYGSRLACFDLATANMDTTIYIPGGGDLDGIAWDGADYLYLLSHNGNLFQVNINDFAYSTFVSSGLGSYPQGMIYDAQNNRLLTCSYQVNCPIMAVNLPEGSVTVAVQTGLNYLDALAEDDAGNIYLTCSGTNSVYRYDHEFLNAPEVVSSGHNAPAGLEFNGQDNILAVANFLSDVVDFVYISPTSVEGDNVYAFPAVVELKQNHPNPFNPTTTISYMVEASNEGSEVPVTVRLRIFDVRGKLVKTLVDRMQKPGSYQIVWDGKDRQGTEAASSVYFYMLEAGDFRSTRKMVLQK